MLFVETDGALVVRDDVQVGHFTPVFVVRSQDNLPTEKARGSSINGKCAEKKSEREVGFCNTSLTCSSSSLAIPRRL